MCHRSSADTDAGLLHGQARKRGIKAVTTLEGIDDPEWMLAVDIFLSPPQTVIHGDLRSANVMFPTSFGGGAAGGGGGTARRPSRLEAQSDAGEDSACIIDWGGLQRGKGAFDVAYLLGTVRTPRSQPTLLRWAYLVSPHR